METNVTSRPLLTSVTVCVCTPQVHYDFTYYKMEMPADVQFLILSEGKSNILPADLVLPFRPSSVASTSGIDGEMLKAWRWYLATMKSLPHSIEPLLQKVRFLSLIHVCLRVTVFYVMQEHACFNDCSTW